MTLSVIRDTLSSFAHTLGFKTHKTQITGEKENKVDFKKFAVIKQIGKAKFSAYLAQSKGHNCAIKVFPFVANKPHKSFENEARFAFLNHANIIKIYHSQQETLTSSQECSKASYIVMEYAPYGNFFGFITKKGAKIDDKILHTYFKQLIEDEFWKKHCEVQKKDSLSLMRILEVYLMR